MGGKSLQLNREYRDKIRKTTLIKKSKTAGSTRFESMRSAIPEKSTMRTPASATNGHREIIDPSKKAR